MLAASSLVANDDIPLSEWASRLVADGQQRYNFTGSRKIGVRQLSPTAKHPSDFQPFWMAVPIRYPRGPTINDIVWTDGRFYVPREQAIASAVMGPLCKQPLRGGGSHAAPLVVDVGANTGYFSLLAAACGCRARAFEPRTDMASFIQLSARFNGWGPERLTLFNKVVTHEKNIKFDGWNAIASDQTLSAGALRRCRAGSKCATDAAAKDSRMASFRNAAVGIDEVVSEDVLYLKVDVEGHEPSALHSARLLLTSATVHYILFEVTYFLFGVFSTPKYIKLLLWLQRLGYTLYHVETGSLLASPSSARLPPTASGITNWLEVRAKACNPQAVTFCQAGNIFAVHPKALWPLRPDPF